MFTHCTYLESTVASVLQQAQIAHVWALTEEKSAILDVWVAIEWLVLSCKMHMLCASEAQWKRM